MKIAVEGCCHGALDDIYAEIARLEQRNGYKVDVLLICGDFQAIRNAQDLNCLAVPQKYRHMGTFSKYYTGEKTAPILTIVIGGNHEASNYLWELYHGGWLAPNIYFLGFAGCVQVNGVRIAGASGIYKKHDYHQGHWEKIPYDNSSMRSIYHIREYDVRRLSMLSSPTIFMSHDWPQHVEQHGDVQALLRRKPHFRQDMETNNLGSPPLKDLLTRLKPTWWFSAHMHIGFKAIVRHGAALDPPSEHGAGGASAAGNPDEILIDDEDLDGQQSAEAAAPATDSAPPPPLNPDEIAIEGELPTVDSAPSSAPGPSSNSVTNFVALDKCLPKRQFLEIVDVPDSANQPASEDERIPVKLTYDPEWLAITRAFHPYLSIEKFQPRVPDEETAASLLKKEVEWVQANIADKGKGDGASLDISECQQFWRTAPGPAGNADGNSRQQPPWYTNPQTVSFCEMLQLENKINPPPVGSTPTTQ